MFCLNYYPFEKYLQDAEQLKITFNPADRTIQDFLQKYQQKSIVVEGSFTQTDLKVLKELYNKYNNFKISIIFQDAIKLKIQQYQIPFFFRDFVTTIDQLHGFMKYKPTDMYICEQLGFSIRQISEILHNNGIKVRVLPNICQSSFSETPSSLKFFIRPEDIPFYSNYVDIFELVSDKNRQAVIYKIYKQNYWAGPINQIIPNFKDNLDSRFVIGAFGQIRANCHKRCLYKPESCDICHRIADLGEVFKNNNIFIKHEKTPVDFS